MFFLFLLLVMLNDHCWYTAHHNVTTLQRVYIFPRFKNNQYRIVLAPILATFVGTFARSLVHAPIVVCFFGLTLSHVGTFRLFVLLVYLTLS